MYKDNKYSGEQPGLTPEKFLDAIRDEANMASFPTTNYHSNTGYLLLSSANECIEKALKKPKQKMLFDVFWHEGEVCILFADTNVGKSILAVQLANSISSGFPVGVFKLESSPQPVIYVDFELSDKQFQIRYSNDAGVPYTFDDNLFRAQLNPDAEVPNSYTSIEDYLIGSMEELITCKGAKVLIIDNITYLGKENEKARDALPLMKRLKMLKQKHDLSILVLAHTPKRDATKPIERNDLAGSKQLINFCDSAFAIGASQKDKKLRYLKQVKQRNTEELFGSENICLCQITKPDNFLHLEFSGFGYEAEHLKLYDEKDRAERISKVKELSARNMTQREIAAELGISLGAVNKYLKN